MGISPRWPLGPETAATYLRGRWGIYSLSLTRKPAAILFGERRARWPYFPPRNGPSSQSAIDDSRPGALCFTGFPSSVRARADAGPRVSRASPPLRVASPLGSRRNVAPRPSLPMPNTPRPAGRGAQRPRKCPILTNPYRQKTFSLSDTKYLWRQLESHPDRRRGFLGYERVGIPL